MLDFTYAVSTKILFGRNTIDCLDEEIERYADKILFLSGGGSIKKFGLHDTILKILEKGDIDYIELSGVQPNPQIDSVRKGIQLCKDYQLDFILGVGGGKCHRLCKNHCCRDVL